MKTRITDPEIIRSREEALFDAISENLDRDALAGVLRARHRLKRITGLTALRGDLAVEHGSVVYKLDFDVRSVISVIFDRDGNYIQPEDEAFDRDEKDASAGSKDAPYSEIQERAADLEEETVTLDEVVYGRSGMIQNPSKQGRSSPQPPPKEKMTRIADELADMISDINGKKKT